MTGELVGALVSAYSVEDELLLASTVTTADGRYQLPRFIYNGPVVVKVHLTDSSQMHCRVVVSCSLGSYTGYNDEDFTLSAMFHYPSEVGNEDNYSLDINLVTELATRRAKELNVFEQAEYNNQLILASRLWGLSERVDEITGMSLLSSELLLDASDDEVKLSMLIPALILMAEDAELTLTEIINRFRMDYISDGGVRFNHDDGVSLANFYQVSNDVLARAEIFAMSRGVMLDLDRLETYYRLLINQVKKHPSEAELIPQLSTPAPDTTDLAADRGIELLLDANYWSEQMQALGPNGLARPFVSQLDQVGLILDSASRHSLYVRQHFAPAGAIVFDQVAMNFCLVEFYQFIHQRYRESHFEGAEDGFEYTLEQAIGHGFDAPKPLLEAAGLVASLNIAPVAEGLVSLSSIRFYLMPQEDGFSFDVTIALDLSSSNTLSSYMFTALRFSGHHEVTTLDYTYELASAGGVHVTYATEETRETYQDKLAIIYNIPLSGTYGDHFLEFNPNFKMKRDSGSTTSVLDVSAWVRFLREDLTPVVLGVFSYDGERDFGSDSPLSELLAPREQLTDSLTFRGVMTNPTPEAKLSFNGELIADASFYQGDEAFNQIIENEHIQMRGKFAVIDAYVDERVDFDGEVLANLDLVKTPTGDPFLLQGNAREYLSSIDLAGILSAQNSEGQALFNVNGAITNDISGLEFTAPSMPVAGELVSKIPYGIRQVDENHTQYFIDYALASDGVDEFLSSYSLVRSDGPGINENFYVDVKTRDCFRLQLNDELRGCELRIVLPENKRFEFPAGLTEIQRNQYLEINGLILRDEVVPLLNPFNPMFLGVEAQNNYQDCSIPDAAGLVTCTLEREFEKRLPLPAGLQTEEAASYLLGFEQLHYQDASFNYVAIDDGCFQVDIEEAEGLVTKVKCEFNFYRNGEFIEIKSMIFSSLNQEADVYEKIALARHGLGHLQRDLILEDCDAESCLVALTLTERLSFHQQMTIAERNVVVDRLKEYLMQVFTEVSYDSCWLKVSTDGELEVCDVSLITRQNIASMVLADNAEVGLLNNMMTDGIDFSVKPYRVGASSSQFQFEASNLGQPIDMQTFDMTVRFIDVVVDYVGANFNAQFYQTDDAFIETSARLNISSDLVGFENIDIDLYADKISQDDMEVNVNLTENASLASSVDFPRWLELNFFNQLNVSPDSHESLLVLNKADASLSVVMSCLMPLEGQACPGEHSFMGEIYVEGIRVAELEDRGGLPVFRFQGDKDLILTPSFIIEGIGH